ncbi:HupE/UreJ family protein [Thiobacillus sp.]|uniref:HupE/UreJ family protein n=1 Tax=Thiobacillus sp. TaxID=924 RepID=UPI0025FA2078|nr:HupE/UreJ family protein [Thiobacillus sp.]MBT9541025.1 HupE/UreJ family protein [Thiobacillus sp.]
MKHTFSALLMMLFTSFAYAHPGEHHGGMLDAIAHLLSEPDHLAMALIAVVVGVAGARFFRRRTAARILAKRR